MQLEDAVDEETTNIKIPQSTAQCNSSIDLQMHMEAELLVYIIRLLSRGMTIQIEQLPNWSSVHDE